MTVIRSEALGSIVRPMTTSRLRGAAEQRARRLRAGFGEDLQRLRQDVGVSQRALARVTGIAQSQISRIEAGLGTPSIETCSILGAGLGADLSIRLFPNTGPPIRDRHQARIVEALISVLDRRWKPWLEVGVRQPVRGWVDLVLADQAAATLAVTEVVSSIHRLEQLLRWSGAKADAIASAPQWPFGTGTPEVTRLLVLRSTRANLALTETFHSTIHAAYPGDPWQAIAALTGDAAWPGSSVLWAADRRDGRIAIIAAPATRRAPTH